MLIERGMPSFSIDGREFPDTTGKLPRQTVERAMLRLERILPGPAAMLADMAGDGG